MTQFTDLIVLLTEDDMKRAIILISITVIFISLNAQFSFENPSPNFNPNFNLGGFLHPDKVKMNHTMSFSSGVDSNGLGFYQSAYTNHLKFDLRDNLKFNVDLSYVNFGTMTHENNLNFNSNQDNQGAFVPAFSLEYKPFTNTTIIIEYQNGGGNDSFFYNRRTPFFK